MRRTDRRESTNQQGLLVYQLAIGLLCAVMTVGSASAFDFGWAAATGYTRTDNVAQSTAGDAADILSAEVSAALKHATRTLAIDADANYLYRYFPDDDYASGSQPQLRSELEWTPIAERVRFSASDVYGQVALNPAEGLLPSNFESANVFTAGSQLSWPLSLGNRIQALGEYRDATFDESSIDTQRTLGELRIQHSLTRLISLFASAGRSHTTFDVDGIASDYDIDSALLGLDAVGRRSALQFSAGVDSLEDDGDTFKGSKYDLRYERQLSREQRIFANATRELADAADVFSLAQSSDPALTAIRDVQVTSQPLIRQAYLLGYALSGSHLSVALAGGYRKERFKGQPDDAAFVGLDRNIRELQVNVDYTWSQRTNLLGRVELQRQRYVNGIESDDVLVRISWLRRLAPRLGFEATVQRIERSHSPLDFDELRFILMLHYIGRELPGQRTGADVFDRSFEQRTRRIRDRIDAAEGSGQPEPADEPLDGSP